MAQERISLARIICRADDTGQPGSSKYLLEMTRDLATVEVALLRMDGETLLCASAQAGCAFGCRHCATTYAPRPFVRSLSAAEIAAYVRLIAREVDLASPLDALDFSGVGDCSANWSATQAASEMLMSDGEILRYTVSTIAPRAWCETLRRDAATGKALPEKVMVSLHGVDAPSRQAMIPCAEDPLEAMSWWRSLAEVGCRVVFNYVVHQGNSRADDAVRLAAMVSECAAWLYALRLSPLNPVAGLSLRAADDIASFVDNLRRLLPHTRVLVFRPIGTGVAMACGQMRAQAQACR